MAGGGIIGEMWGCFGALPISACGSGGGVVVFGSVLTVFVLGSEGGVAVLGSVVPVDCSSECVGVYMSDGIGAGTGHRVFVFDIGVPGPGVGVGDGGCSW